MLPVGNIPPEKIREWLPQQAPSSASADLKEALLAMRVEMLLDSQPQAAVCIGGMEGIEAEARLYLDLAAMGRIPAASHLHVFGSTFGAAAKLEGEQISFADESCIDVLRAADDGQAARADALNFPAGEIEPRAEPIGAPLGPSEETARHDSQHPISYDGINRLLLQEIILQQAR